MSAPSGSGNHVLQDYQMRLALLQQQTKKELTACQELNNMTLDRNDKSLLEPRVPLRRQSDLRHGLLTPRSSPESRCRCPSPPASISYAPVLNPSLTGQTHNVPFYPPPTGVSNTSPFLPQQSLQYSANTYPPQISPSFGYQEYQYPQTKQFPIAEPPESDSSTHVAFVPEEWPSLEPNLDNSPIQSAADSSCESMKSKGSWESMASSRTYNTVDLEVLTPKGQWDEPPGWKDSSGFESKFKTSTDQDFDIINFLLTESNFVEQSLTGCNETSPSLLNTANEDLCFPGTISNKFNLTTNRNLDINTKLYPVEPTETIPKKASRSSGLSSILQEHEQGGDQSKSMVNENRAERRDYQASVSQNLSFASKYYCNESTPISTEAPALPCATNSVVNTMLGQDFAYDQRQPSSPSQYSRSGSETCSWLSDNETDWGDDESDDTNRSIGTLVIEGSNISGEQELPNLVAKPVLSKLKKELVDRIMVEFWQIFNQAKEINICEDTISRSTPSQQCKEQNTSHGEQQNTAPASKSGMKFNVQINGTRSTGFQNGKRKLQSQDEDENDETEKRNPKRPKGLSSPPQNQDDTNKFACPYRKHDAKKYCVRHWRSCALTPLETVARVKGHLYRHHRIFPCQRCKKLFNDQQGVNDHLMEPQGCKLLEVVQQDGITNEMVEKLRSKKKAHRDQSERDRWKEIYQILFPGEMVPNPFFEEIQEDVIQSPDSQELADYEEYCRRELPRVFRASLEEVVNNNTQPLEEQLRSQLMDLVRDAQDRVFSSYRSSSITTRTPARGAPSSSPPANLSSSLSRGSATSPPRSQPTPITSTRDRSEVRLPPFFQPPSPQNHLESGLGTSDPNITPSKSDRNNRSDSGYDSSSFVMPSTLPLTPGESSVSISTSSSQTFLSPEGAQETTNHADGEAGLMQAKPDSNVEAITSAGNNYLNSESPHLQNILDFELDYADLSDFDTNHEFGNYDFSQTLDRFL